MSATTFSIPVYLMMAYCPNIPPLVLTVSIGIVYTFDVIIMWQVTINLLPPAVFGTGAGVAVFMMRFSIGLTNLSVGTIVENKESLGHQIQIHAYQDALLLMTGLSVMAVLSGVLLNIIDIRRGDGVNRRFMKEKVKGLDTSVLILDDKLNKRYDAEGNSNLALEEYNQ
ncbi:hypothetical protein KP79_PYT19687 [Mizuhopecten yessoensis]|uniref:Uncharacterized protein n=2 Tax=Mizuhopecten yessoensis TaxID=6573 RepID=A0A210PU42_MIZYE|nr:hypothetical protein KP79_PYT19687 [Mizuhopecten yessoensis]